MWAFLLAFLVSGTESRDLGCLEDRWQELAPVQSDRAFDLDNDYDRSGNRFSCNSYVTPTAINAFLTELKQAVAEGNRETVASLIYFPTRVGLAETFVTEAGHLKGRSFLIEDKAAFLVRYDEIMLPTLKDAIACIKLTNMFAHPYKGISSVGGNLWFGLPLYEEMRPNPTIRVVSLSVDTKSHKTWLSRNCEE